MSFLIRCWRRRWVRGLAWTLITLLTLYALLTAWVNWSGARRWRDVQAMFREEGETLDFRALLDEPIPEPANFCAIPLLKDIALAVENDVRRGEPAAKRQRLEGMKLAQSNQIGRSPKFDQAALGQPANLESWAAFLRPYGTLEMPAPSGHPAREILTALGKHDDIFSELAAGLTRPLAAWTPEWKTRELPEQLFSILMPHSSSTAAMGQTIALRAVVAARSGSPRLAHESAQFLARLGQASLHDPFLIGTLMAQREATLLCNVTWEICDTQSGGAEDFARLESALTSFDMKRAVLRSWRAEIAAQVNIIQYFRRRPDGFVSLVSLTGQGRSSVLGSLVTSTIPRGFFDGNCAVLAERELHHVIRPLRAHDWAAAFRGAAEFEDELMSKKAAVWSHPSWILPAMLAPSATRLIHRAAHTQAQLSLAAVACALERARLENGGEYPDSLDSLRLASGQPLPLDPMNRQPMGYRKSANGKYALWSVGADGEDDGGKRELDEKQPIATSFLGPKYAGDWVWDYPEK